MTGPDDASDYPRFHRSSTLDDFVAASKALVPSDQQTADDPPRLAADETQHRSRLKIFGLVGVAGILLIVVGFALGIVSYDERFIYDDPSPIWELAATIGLLLVVLGVVLVPISIIGALVVGIVRFVRRLSH